MKILSAEIGKDKHNSDIKANEHADFHIRSLKDIATGFAMEANQQIYDRNGFEYTTRQLAQQTLGTLVLLAAYTLYGPLACLCSGTYYVDVDVYNRQGEHVANYRFT